MCLEASGSPPTVSDKSTLGPDTSSALLFFAAFRLDGCDCDTQIFQRGWAVFLEGFASPSSVADKPALGPDTIAALSFSM